MKQIKIWLMPIGLRCCAKLQENLLVVSEQGMIFHMLYVYPNLVVDYHVHYLWLMVIIIIIIIIPLFNVDIKKI